MVVSRTMARTFGLMRIRRGRSFCSYIGRCLHYIKITFSSFQESGLCQGPDAPPIQLTVAPWLRLLIGRAQICLYSVYKAGDRVFGSHDFRFELMAAELVGRNRTDAGFNQALCLQRLDA